MDMSLSKQRYIGEYATRVDRVAGGYAVAGISYFECPPSGDCSGPAYIFRTKTAYLIHSHPSDSKYGFGPSTKDFSVLAKINDTDPDIKGIVIRRDGSMIEYKRVDTGNSGWLRAKTRDTETTF
jgi:hypothetical protein